MSVFWYFEENIMKSLEFILTSFVESLPREKQLTFRDLLSYVLRDIFRILSKYTVSLFKRYIFLIDSKLIDRF